MLYSWIIGRISLHFEVFSLSFIAGSPLSTFESKIIIVVLKINAYYFYLPGIHLSKHIFRPNIVQTSFVQTHLLQLRHVEMQVTLVEPRGSSVGQVSVGDKIIAINHEKLQTVKDLNKQLSKPGKVCTLLEFIKWYYRFHLLIKCIFLLQMELIISFFLIFKFFFLILI